MSNPSAHIVGTPIRYDLDGVTDDLLTAGLGVEGLRGVPPTFADPLRPTARELRRRAIYMNYRGLVDITADGGFGTLFGAPGHALVAGVEFLFAIHTPDGSGTTTGLLQIPSGFDPRNPCLVAVASSGSRGIYGALPTAGEWGLRHNCAVVHSDKGTGTGLFDADRGRGVRIDGTLTDADDPLITFAPSGAAVERLQRNRPHSVLFKHASSGLNIEAHWGEYLLQAIDAAFQLLNREYPRADRALTPENTLVIASGISNGGGAVLRALERDRAGWIDGAVVSEPNVMVAESAQGLVVASGGRTYDRVGASLYDYTTEHMLLQPCALLAEAELSAPVRNAVGAVRGNLEQWCRDLSELGVLTRTQLADQAQEARRALLESGILPDALQIGHLNVMASVWTAIAAGYASAYARLAPDELPCGVSFSATDASGAPRMLTDEELARAFSDSGGIAPTAGVSLVAPDATSQPRAANQGNAALAACLRSLHTGRSTGSERTPDSSFIADSASIAQRLAGGEREIAMTARLPGRPVIILQGRADALIPVNHSSRAYYAITQRNDNPNSQVRYYEVEHGQHFDAFLALPDLAQRYVPLQPNLLHAMDLMAAHLRSGSDLPPSQVVRSRPRGIADGKIAPLSPENIGAVLDRPGMDAITFEGHTLHVP
jgi:hydroxybutyrate-dimer hydrolase